MIRRLTAALKWTATLLNILEPDTPNGKPILSISKIAMWATLGLTIWIGIKNPTSAELAAALGAQVAATANYGFRRWMQVRTKTGGYAKSA